MRNCLLIAVVTILYIGSPSLYASCSLETVNQRLSEQKISADFVQSKKIAILTRSLKSSGKIWMSDDEELVWMSLKPFRSTMVIQADGIRQYDKNDRYKGMQNQTVVTDLSNVFLSLVKGDVEKLDEAFEIEFECVTKENVSDSAVLSSSQSIPKEEQYSPWTMVLTPRTDALKKLISKMSLSGAQTISKIHFIEQRGDETEIGLHQSKDMDASLFDAFLSKGKELNESENEPEVNNIEPAGTALE